MHSYKAALSNVLAITKSIIILNTYKSSEKVNINYHLYIYTCRFSLFSKVKIFHVQSFFFFAKRMHHVSVNKKKIWLLSQLLINRYFYPNMQLYQWCQIIKILVCNKIFDQLGELFHKKKYNLKYKLFKPSLNLYKLGSY